MTPEKVLIATGAPKNQRPDRDYDPTIFGFAPKEKTQQLGGAKAEEAVAEVAEETAASEEAPVEEDMVDEDLDAESQAIEDSDPAKDIKKQIMELRTKTKTLLTNPPKKLSGGLKQDLRAFSKSLKTTLSRAASTDATTMDELEADFASLSERASATPAPVAAPASEAKPDSTSKKSKQSNYVSNPRDDTKPYHTPWRPRDFMSAFAFIPRYLEVNQNICSAVYLRHPVAKPGLAEVPTPFHPETGQLTFNWYLRRR